ncbi:MAG TPA: GntR family transcriptional regulator, partial [Streptosporangiaceae bacterium]
MQDLHLELDPACGGRAAQIADAIRYAVRAGRLSAGHRLPPTRALASDLGVSRGVVVEAYERLSAEGFLVSRQGSGTRVAPRATPDGAADASADVDALLDAADVGPMPPAPLDVRAAIEIDRALYDAARQVARQGAQLAEKAGLVAEPLVVADQLTAADTLLRVAKERDAQAVIVGTQ